MRALALVVAVAASCAPARPPLQQLPPDARLFEGTSPFVAAERYKGRVVVLDFWAGWCAECKRTVPQVQRLASAFAKDGLVVVGVNAGEQLETAQASARDFGIDYPIALDPELELSDRLVEGKLPMLLVVDRDGTIVHRAKTVDARALQVIRELLARPQASD